MKPYTLTCILKDTANMKELMRALRCLAYFDPELLAYFPTQALYLVFVFILSSKGQKFHVTKAFSPNYKYK